MTDTRRFGRSGSYLVSFVGGWTRIREAFVCRADLS